MNIMNKLHQTEHSAQQVVTTSNQESPKQLPQTQQLTIHNSEHTNDNTIQSSLRINVNLARKQKYGEKNKRRNVDTIDYSTS